MIYLTSLYNQKSCNSQILLQDLGQFANDPNVRNLCKNYRETGKITFKLKLPVLIASGRHFWIDIDGNNHINGNAEIDINLVTSLIPHVAWFTSPSGVGIKMLIEINRDPTSTEERKAIGRYLINKISKITVHKTDKCRTDIAFVSDLKLSYSNGIFQLPDNLEVAVSSKHTSKTSTSILTFLKSNKLSDLTEMLDYFPQHDKYENWLGYVMASLSMYGEQAIPLLESKWDSEIPYETILTYSEDADTKILEDLWANRIRKNSSKLSKYYERRVVTGATGAGKSQYAIDEINNLFSEYDDEYSNYVIYVVSSVEQAIDFANKLEHADLSYEVLVSEKTYSNQKPVIKLKLKTKSSYNTAVKIIQLESLKRNAHQKFIRDDNRKLCTIYIDELTFHDFVRPSINSSNIVKSYTGRKSDDDIVTCYSNKFSESDLYYAQVLSSLNDNSPFISSMLYQEANTTVLTTEELTTICLEKLGFAKTTIKLSETKALQDRCTLNISESTYYVLKYAESESLNKTINDMKFDNIFANNCIFANGNLVSIKGQHLRGKNLSIIRNLPRDFTSALKELFHGCFKTLDIDPVSIYYKDVLLQAVGRSIGFRGDNEAWVMVHSHIWNMIKDTPWIYKICMWDIEINDETKHLIDTDRIRSKELFKDRDEELRKWKRQDKEAKIRLRFIATENPNDKIYPVDIKNLMGDGVTLKNVSDALNVPLSRNNSSRYLQCVKTNY